MNLKWRCAWCRRDMAGPFWMIESVDPSHSGECHLICEDCRYPQIELFRDSVVEETKPLSS